VSASEIRADVFAALRELSEVIPEKRAGQLMAAVGELCTDLHGRGLWDAGDDQLPEAVWQFRRKHEAAVSGSREAARPSVAADPLHGPLNLDASRFVAPWTAQCLDSGRGFPNERRGRSATVIGVACFPAHEKKNDTTFPRLSLLNSAIRLIKLGRKREEQ
jgi:hypothetical protein